MDLERAVIPIQFDHVADLYDTYVHATFDIPFYLAEASKVRGKVLELMCGTGRVSIPLLRAGVELTCVDYSRRMLGVFLEKLAEEHLHCRVFAMDVCSLSVPGTYDLIVIPFHAYAEILEESQRRRAWEGISAHLSPDGCFILALHNPMVRRQSMDGVKRSLGRFPSASGHTLEVSTRLEYDHGSHLARGCQWYQLSDGEGRIVDHRRLEMNFYLSSRTEIEKLAREMGFDVEAVYGDYDYSGFQEESSPYMIWKFRHGGRGNEQVRKSARAPS